MIAVKHLMCIFYDFCKVLVYVWIHIMEVYSV